MMDTFDVIKNKLADYKILIAIVFVILVSGIFLLVHTRTENTPVAAYSAKAVSSVSDTVSSTSSTVKSTTAIMVDIKGAVKTPGVYDIIDNPRVQTLIARSGGVTAQADINQVNLAQKLTDGQMIYIPVKGERLPNHSTANTPNTNSNQTQVNLNTATIEELQTLEGVGAKKAEQIIAYRDEHGGFKSIEEIKQVAGVGDKRFEAIQDKITV
ncbi:transporter [Leuconostoc carnosum]|uniref:Competence protein CelA n=1 Tax=Leuconostoc carnosum (strain JB16) TaxID=1229758 RepID=K0DCT0_LEUCJ|nr:MULTISPECIES: helix-hairpin-helix domain-containing protein [Leuconostoc]AFT81302.1 competence protein CelA [Leuconostoc carnosum JB16]KAA8326634.1 transporter [Leuconostoc carnosum]KAA8330121.1 transporter [Leuconostoc carnosum]KAA8362195.1 transporter [Leuconostoc carnosum]KAA8366744.1 transporter [Leuconostoc carnosum]